MSVEIGINPITWTNDDLPELGGDIPLETCLSEASQAGYAGIEMGGKFPRNAAELGPLLAGTGCASCQAGTTGASATARSSEEFDAILPHLTLLRDLGCQGRGVCRHVARPA